MTLADIDWPMILAGLGLFLFGIEYWNEKNITNSLSL